MFTQVFYTQQTPLKFLNNICLKNKFENAVHKVKLYLKKNYL